MSSNLEKGFSCDKKYFDDNKKYRCWFKMKIYNNCGCKISERTFWCYQPVETNRRDESALRTHFLDICVVPDSPIDSKQFHRRLIKMLRRGFEKYARRISLLYALTSPITRRKRGSRHHNARKKFWAKKGNNLESLFPPPPPEDENGRSAVSKLANSWFNGRSR